MTERRPNLLLRLKDEKRIVIMEVAAAYDSCVGG